MRHKSQRNTRYFPRLRISIHWTWKGMTHYLDFGSEFPWAKKPPFPGKKAVG